MIKIIAEGVYDTAHAVFEAHEIKKIKPDAVFFELPEAPFQRILNDYSAGKLNIKQLKTKLFKAIGAEEKIVDHELLNKFLVGEIEKEELEVIETEGREIHVMKAAKDVGASMYAVDLPLKKVEELLLKEFAQEHVDATTRVVQTKKLPFIVWELSDIFHYPYYFIERVLHHHALVTTNPYKHNVNNCSVCKAGVAFDRFMNSLLLPVLDKLPLSKGLKTDLKVAYALRELDFYREQHMAGKIAGVYKSLQKKLGREPRVVVIVHLWNALELERLLQGLR